MNVKRRARLLGVEAYLRIVLALGARILKILLLQAAHQFPMAIQPGIRELTVQHLQQLSEGLLLLRSARIVS